MNVPSGWELILVLLVIVVVFGSKRLPESARALGRSMRILKAETRGLHDDESGHPTTAAPAPGLTANPLPRPATVLPTVNGYSPTGSVPVSADGARPAQAPSIEQQRQP